MQGGFGLKKIGLKLVLERYHTWSKSNPIFIILKDMIQFCWPNSVYYKCIIIPYQKHRDWTCELQEQNSIFGQKKWGLDFIQHGDSKKFKSSNTLLGVSVSYSTHPKLQNAQDRAHHQPRFAQNSNPVFYIFSSISMF